MRLRLALLLLALLVGACAQVPTRRPELVGYYASWTGQPAQGAELLSAIDFAFLALGAEGVVGVANPSDESAIAHLRDAKRRHPDLLLFGSVGGWTSSGNFSNVAHDREARARFTATSLEFLRRAGFDGIDIDWEYPGAIGAGCPAGATCDRPTDKEDFIRLVGEMRAAFDAAGAADHRRYFITVAAGVDAKYASNESGGRWLARLARPLDWVNLMTYDYHGNWERTANFVAPLRRDPAAPTGESIDASVSIYLAEGISPDKLVLGVPFYGKGWTGCAPGPRGDGRYQACADIARPDHEASFEFFYLEDEKRFGYPRAWNDAAAEASLFDAATGTFIAYDDERSMREKARYAKERGLRGVMFWELTADRRGTLLRALADELGR